MSEWQPIETAPKDGTDFVAVTDYGKYCVMYFDGEHFVRTVTCRRCFGMGLGSLKYWMPLPKLPEQEQP